mmetsp:Transcript_34179/g.92530  ORF Transcript_34179/g.92530 Transcript_34179/m.92530 type:complete len:301 (-) Transcript_34179:117-1019(-)
MPLELLARTPLGSRVVFGVCIFVYVLYSLDHHAFVALDLTCRPVDVVYGLQVQRLLLASFAHTSLPGLCLALALCWRRFAWLENQFGTMGFLLWFMWCSVLLHAVYCLAYVLFAPILGGGIAGSEVHGLFPLLTASLVLGIHSSDAGAVWLWPLPLHVDVRVLPLVVIALAWILHWEAHYDVAVAYLLARAAPWLVEPEVLRITERAEQTALGKVLLARLQDSDAFVCRPPFLSSEDPCAAAKLSGAPSTPYHEARGSECYRPYADAAPRGPPGGGREEQRLGHTEKAAPKCEDVDVDML